MANAVHALLKERKELGNAAKSNRYNPRSAKKSNEKTGLDKSSSAKHFSGGNLSRKELAFVLDVNNIIRGMSIATISDKTRLKEDIKAHYSNAGMDVSDKVIDAGIYAYETRYFGNGARPYFILYGLAALLVNRRFTKAFIITTIMLLILAIPVHYFFVTLPDEKAQKAEVAKVNYQFTQAQDDITIIKSRIESIKLMLEKIEPADAIISDIYQNLTSNVLSILNDLSSMLNDPVAKAQDSPITIEQYNLHKDALYKALYQKRALYRKSSSTFVSVDRTLKNMRELNGLAGRYGRMKAFVDTYNVEPHISKEHREHLTKAATALTTMDLKNAEAHLHWLENMHAKAEMEKNVSNIYSLWEHFLATGVSDKDQKIVDHVYQKALSAARQGNLDVMNKQIKLLQDISKQLNQELTLSIVNNPQYKTGITLSYIMDTYYLIVEPKNSKGEVVEVILYNPKNNAFSKVNRYGIQVTRLTYDKVRVDKFNDGVIQPNTVGYKSKGAIEFTYQTMIKDGQILNGIIIDTSSSHHYY